MLPPWCNDPNSLQPPRPSILDNRQSPCTNRTSMKLTIVSALTRKHIIITKVVIGQVVNSWNNGSNPNRQILSAWIKSMSSETIGQPDVTPDHPPVTELHAVSREWAVLHSILGPTCHMHEKEISSLSWCNTNSFHSPISHHLSLSRRTRVRKN